MVISDIVNPGMSILNASTAYATLDWAKKFPATFLNDMALAAADEVAALICESGHPLKNNFITSSAALGDDTVITPATGGGTVYDVLSVKVDGVDARRKPVTYFKRLGSDPLSRTQIGKYYDLQGLIIRHNGTSAVCKIIRFVKGATPQAPDQMLNAVISCFLSMVFVKQGEGIQAASYFAQQWMLRAQMIREGKMTVPAVAAFQDAERE